MFILHRSEVQHTTKGIPMTAAEIIRQCRDKRGLTQRQLAELVGIPHQRINEWENGIYEPGFENVSKVLMALGYSLSVVEGEAR